MARSTSEGSEGTDLKRSPPRPSAMASPRPLPSLPAEVKAAVFSHADQPTLAAACRSSLALLELAGPLLYHSPEIKSLEALDLLFCSIVSRLLSALPQNADHLSQPAVSVRVHLLAFHLPFPVPLSNTCPHNPTFQPCISRPARPLPRSLPRPLSATPARSPFRLLRETVSCFGRSRFLRIL